MNQVVICKEIKCNDYLTDEGEPAWCFQAGQPAQVAVDKCPKLVGQKQGANDEKRNTNTG